MFGECRDIIMQYAVQKPDQVVLETVGDSGALARTATGGGRDYESATRATTNMPSNSHNLVVENQARLALAKCLSLRKLFHFDLFFKLYAPLWCLENAYPGNWETNRINTEDYIIRTKSQKKKAGRITTTFLDEEVFAMLNKLISSDDISGLVH